MRYFGPIDGHNITKLVDTLKDLRDIPGPKLLHIITTKGKGYALAEKDQTKWHAPGLFDKLTGEIIKKKIETPQPPKYQDVFGHSIVELAKVNPQIMGVTPAMPSGSSLKFMMDSFPDRAFDVGIAEQHAVTLAAGMATQGLTVFCNIYSTFLQRAYDQVIHDVAIQNLPVIFCLDRAGLVGEDGATHHGVFDLAYLRCIPNMIIFSPRNEIELRNMLYTAQLGLNYPIAIRYPRGRGEIVDWQKPFQKIEIGKATLLKKGSKTAILSNGFIGRNVTLAITEISNATLFSHYDFSFVKPLDEELLHSIFEEYENIVTIEDGTIIGGFGSAIAEFKSKYKYKNDVQILGIPDQFIEQGTVEELQRFSEINVKSLVSILSTYRK